ncbi:MAG TPA: glycine betaine ABC transporter substrate-binding protein [Pyrinomonadaceae bacterium]|nr:glycine betaine ABC transporter substrate-binding protein [Pyrinomonadaceae bacterium]
MSFWSFLEQNGSELLTLVAQHLKLVLVSTLIAVLIGIPTGILLTRNRALRKPILGLANVMQTIPSLALFGFLIPIPFIGGIGARTAIVALVLYALLPIIRNTVTGILGIDQNVRQAAVAMGMTAQQILWQVELPLAASVILTGVRVAMVISVGVTTIAAAVGAGGLGVYIFRGLRQYDNNLLLAGAIPAALMALASDSVLGLAEKWFGLEKRREKTKGWIGTVGVIAIALTLVLLGFGFWRSFQSPSGTLSGKVGRLVVGSKDFTESGLLAEIVAQMVEARGVAVERLELGGNLPHDALVSGRIDLYPEYTGTAFTAILHHPPITDPRAVYDQVKQEYGARFHVDVSPPLGFENTFAILVRAADATRLNLKTISDVTPLARGWRAGFGQDFMSRADGYPGFARAYGLQFAEQPHEMDLSLTYIALSSGKVDLIAGNSTEGRIGALNLVQLEDDRHYFPPYEAIYLVRQDSLQRVPVLQDILTQLANKISTAQMRKLNYEVDALKRNPAEVVREWLKAEFLVAAWERRHPCLLLFDCGFAQQVGCLRSQAPKS